MKLSLFKQSSIVFLIVSLGLVAGSFFFLPPHIITSLSVLPQNDFTATQTFEVPIAATYRISVRYSKAIAIDRLMALLNGGLFAQISLAGNTTPVPLDVFEIPFLQDTPPNFSELGDVVANDDFVKQEIAEFQGTPGVTYDLLATVVHPADELALANPTIVIARDPLDVEQIAFHRLLTFAGAALSMLLGVVLGQSYAYRKARLQKIVTEEPEIPTIS